MPGSPGGPGRPPSIKDGKHKLTHLKQRLEIAVRENISEAQIGKIVGKMCDLAESGNVRAAKLILDKVVSNAGEGAAVEEAGDNVRRVIFQIENATFAAIKDRALAEPTSGKVIDIEATVLTPSEDIKGNGT